MTRRVGRTLRLSVPAFTVGVLAVVAALGWKIGPPGASGPKGGVHAPLPCGGDDPARVAPAADLYCFDLIPRPDVREATGSVELGRVRSPFDISVSRDGHQLYEIAVSLDGLPDPRSLGAYTAYVAWVTTPHLDPVVKLGEVGNGRARLGRVAFNKFLVLISAEATSSVETRSGRLMLRGNSPSVRLQRHDMLLLGPGRRSPAGSGSKTDGAQAPGGPTNVGWTAPPMNPAVPRMMPGLDGLVPSANPFLPGQGTDPGSLPAARPSEIVELQDGDTLALEAVLVRRIIEGREFRMYGFNGQYPDP